MNQHQWWHNTTIKYSVVLKAFGEFMKDKRHDAKHTPYDQRHLKAKPQ